MLLRTTKAWLHLLASGSEPLRLRPGLVLDRRHGTHMLLQNPRVKIRDLVHNLSPSSLAKSHFYTEERLKVTFSRNANP